MLKSLCMNNKTKKNKIINYLKITFFEESENTLLKRFISFLIILSLIVVVLETEISLSEKYKKIFNILENLFLTVFILEYLLRLILSGHIKKFSGFRGKVKYIFSFMAIIDLLAILPSLIMNFSSDFLLLRIIRLLRMLRVIKILQDNPSINLFFNAIYKSRFQLYASMAITFIILFLSSIFIYILEGSIQPNEFGSIPRSMWWAISTITTVGYGDVYPITLMGKVLAGIVAICGIGIIAMPAGIISANFNSMHSKNKSNEKNRK